MAQDSLRFITLEDIDYIKLKELDGFLQKLMNQRTRLKIQLTSNVDYFFYKKLFLPSLHQNSVYTIPNKAWTPNAINERSLSIQITQTIEQLELLAS